ncbi:MAG TPA: hypothetical protein VFK02_10110 [Kofleriaceae bacterium]|nr:hypothetical protein [Kofleriaceae bacterium]
MNHDTLAFNGIDGRTGDYLLPSVSVAQIARLALGHAMSATERHEVDLRLGVDLDFPLKEGEDPDDLSQAGWAVVFPFARKGSEAAVHQAGVREALEPLLALRRSQAARRDDRRYRECVGPDAYRPGETKQQFLARMGAGPGPVDPGKFPYYVLLVASPEEIPYRVQYQLDVQYAIGRLHFDTIDEYAHYAANVVEVESRPRPAVRTAVLWGVENPDDRATRASCRHLVAPLADYLARDQADRWTVTRLLGEHATKARLASLLGADCPSLLVTASHGVGFSAGDPRQRSDQGALLCQDWGGPRSGALTADHYFSGDDIAADADLRGLVGFHFACFGAGTPRHDDFSRKGDTPTLDIAPHAFVARLPQRMLGRPRGALACIGHVDRAWASSFLQADPHHAGAVTAQLAVFESALKRLMDGRCVGHAMDYFDLRYAELASDLAARIEDATKYDVAVDDHELAQLWIYANDARDYAVIGDPAVRLGGSAVAPALDDRSGAAPVESHHEVLGDRPDAVGPPGPEAPSGPDAPSAAGGRSDGGPVRDPDGVPVALAGLARTTLDALRRALSDVRSFEVTTYAGDLARARAAAAEKLAGQTAAEGAGEVTGGIEGGIAGGINGAIDGGINGEISGHPRPHAYTCCRLDGDTIQSVPVDERGAIDVELWRIHEQSVAQARAHRAEILRLVLSLVPGSAP